MPPGAYVKVEVQDDGIGMSADVRVRAFEPFFTTKEVGKGSGLGLSQVDGFVRQLGGFVDLSSQPGEGTKVAIYLPAMDSTDMAAPARTESEGTVLIVEDDPDVLVIAVEIFRGLGYYAATASNAVDALALLARDDQIRLVFSDIVMPDGPNGLELAREARGLRPGLPIVLTSGYPQHVPAAEQRELAEFHFIPKPYRVADVAAQVQAIRNAAGRPLPPRD